MLDMMGKPCPIPVIEAKKALNAAKVGEQVKLLVDNQVACQNLEKMAKGMQAGFDYMEQEDGAFLVSLTKGQKEEAQETPDLVIAIGSSQMGKGDEELGTMLMKSYLYSLTELDVPPQALLFFNGGIFMTTEGSAALEDLRTLAQKGTQIYSCGACLDFYGKKQELAVGSITNMYAIATTMAQAKRLVNL